MQQKQVTWIFVFDPLFPDPQRLRSQVQHSIVLDPRAIHSRNLPKIEPPFVGYGPMAAMLQLLQIPDLCEAVFDNYRNLRCSQYYSYLYQYLQRDCFFAPLATLHHLPLQRYFGKEVFVRPDSNFKSFSGRVIAVEDVPTFQKNQALYQEELVVLSEVLDLGQEYRCFCHNNRVFAHSSYPPKTITSSPR